MVLSTIAKENGNSKDINRIGKNRTTMACWLHFGKALSNITKIYNRKREDRFSLFIIQCLKRILKIYWPNTISNVKVSGE